jgi:FLVCR family MFS transporter 7
VTSSNPPSPPSPSAAAQANEAEKAYWPNMRALFSNKAFLVLFLFVGAAMGYVSTISTKIEQILCARGYSDQLSGLSGSLILLVGFLASFPFGVLAYKTGRLALICKACCFAAIAAMVALAYLMRVADRAAAIAACCAMLGAFALGVYPLALELLVECTYPVDQATGTAFIFLSSAIQGVLLMQVRFVCFLFVYVRGWKSSLDDQQTLGTGRY